MNHCIVLSIVPLLAGAVLAAPQGRRDRARSEAGQPAQKSACLDVPAQSFDLILGRPTRDSVTVSVLGYEDMEGYFTYGTRSGDDSGRTAAREFQKGRPSELLIGLLRPDTQYYYRFYSRSEATGPFLPAPEHSFHTQRPPGSSFAFTITADSHLDQQTSSDLYKCTLANALADRPDFHIDLGDTFMTEKHASRDHAARQYLAQRYYFGLISHSAPLFLVLGNHDGEEGRWLDGTADNLGIWSNTMRKRYFPNPVPDGFYTGNTAKDRFGDLLQDYYAWEWGDALFIVLDPFWFTSRQRGRDENWTRTLGDTQYRWLTRTLESSKAKFKLVFIHHLVGGLDKDGRGGSEVAGWYEWGGRNADGTDGFRKNRPGWPAPIHELLVRSGATVVFHGHDHFFARQDLDGVVYQEVPQPGHPRGSTQPAATYGYTSGTILGGSGHLRVAVSNEKVTVDFIQARLSGSFPVGGNEGLVVNSYSISAGR